MPARTLALSVCAAAAIGCGGNAALTGPTAAPAPAPFSGSYTLTVDASPACRLRVSHFEWAVVATTASAAGGQQAQVTLPDGDARLDLFFQYGLAPDPSQAIGNFETITHGDGLPIGGGLTFTTNSVVYGTVARGSDGRARLAGNVHGPLALLEDGQHYLDEDAESCTAADHRWTLAGR